ncbi:type I addiction module toxin, SymE family [Thalassomonas viridans]|uniref:Type I addiction module toxin, SymE family n=1 Tax=Thalassomonas viridans TaxID=137584 RepID=A0AAF0C944_9GAMM|nr:SymE family type I addiction module toxin [Thalassomonas viridans]WDE04845.1 type I addiction module toxin, SymE family [Thalassomonas viridans]
MAEYHHTSLAPAKAKYPVIRHLTVLETTCESAVKVRGVGINYVPVNLEPCIIIRGKWLRQAGFATGQKVRITVNEQDLRITPKLPAAND